MKCLKVSRSISFLLILMMVFTLAACGSAGKTGNESQTAAGASKESNAASNETTGPAMTGKYAPAIEITSIRQDLGTNYKFDEGETYENNVWTKAYEEVLGIKLKYNWIVSQDQYVQKFGVAVASEDLPDIFDVNSKNLKMLVDNEMLADLTQTFDQYASPLTKEIIVQDGGIGMQTATFKGKLLAVPETNSIVDNIEMIWIREDWLKNLGLSEPKTMEELLKVMDAFVNQDPDGNKKKDTYGLAVSKDFVNMANGGAGYGGWADLTGFFFGYHAYPFGWIKDASGSLVYAAVQPEMKAPLAKLAEMYKAGMIDTEFGVKDGQKVAETSGAGKVGIAYGAMWDSLWPLQTSLDNDPKALWKAIPIVSADDKPAMSLVGSPVGTWHVVNKNCKNPEALVKMVNLWVDLSYGPNADPLTYSNTKEGKEIFKLSMFRIWPATKNLDCHLAVVDAINTKDTSKLNPEAKGLYDKTLAYQAGDNTMWGMAAVFGPGGSQSICAEVNKGKSWVFNEFYGAQTATQIEKDATLKKMQDEAFTKIIMGKAPIDEFDRFVEQWKKLGGEQITAEINEWYAAKK